MKILAPLLLLPAAGFLLFVAQKRPSSNFAVLSGACLALAAFALPVLLWLTPLVALPLFDRRHPLRARIHLVGSALLGLGLLSLPWALRRV
jgi:hypothetical protein